MQSQPLLGSVFYAFRQKCPTLDIYGGKGAKFTACTILILKKCSPQYTVYRSVWVGDIKFVCFSTGKPFDKSGPQCLSKH